MATSMGTAMAVALSIGVSVIVLALLALVLVYILRAIRRVWRGGQAAPVQPPAPAPSAGLPPIVAPVIPTPRATIERRL